MHACIHTYIHAHIHTYIQNGPHGGVIFALNGQKYWYLPCFVTKVCLKPLFCGFPHRHGDGRRKPENRDETCWSLKTSVFFAILLQIFMLSSSKIFVFLRVFISHEAQNFLPQNRCFVRGIRPFHHICPAGSAPAALASLLFDPLWSHRSLEKSCFATFLPFRAPGSSFF